MLNPRTFKRSSEKAREMKNRSIEGFDSYKQVKKHVKIYIFNFICIFYSIKLEYYIV